METNVQDQIDLLVKLQEIDNKAVELKTDLASEEEKVAEYQAKIQALDNHIARHREEKEQAEAQQRALEADIADVRALIKKSNDRLNQIKNVREHKALSREVEDNQKRIKEMEDAQVECMERIEAADKALSALEEERLGLADVHGELKSEVEKKAADGEKELGALDKTRKQVAKNVPNTLYGRYQTISRALNGQAVVPVESAVCKGCNMNIPPQVFNELQQGKELKYCPHCERIIYWRQES